MSNTPAVQTKRDIQHFLESDGFKKQVTAALPTHMKADRMIRVALTALSRTPKLLQCTQESFFKCLLDLSSLGIEPDGRRAHLIPYGQECTLIVDYKGLAELVMRSGLVSRLHADVVCENDVFSYNLGEIIEHKIDFRQPRGAMFAAYAICFFKDGTKGCAVLGRDEVDGIRKRSRASGSGPWVTDYNEMAKKTAFRRLSKWLPLSAEFRDALAVDDEETQEARVEKTVFDAKPPLFAGADAVDARTAAQIQEEDSSAPAAREEMREGLGMNPSVAPATEKPEATTDETPLAAIRRMLKDAGMSEENFFAHLQDAKIASSKNEKLSDIRTSTLVQIVANFETLVNDAKGE